MKSFLKWAGSKRLLLPRLLESVPKSFERYVEPFAGSACLFFALEPSRALLADINPELIGTYKQLKRSVESIIVKLDGLKMGSREYYRLRALNPKDLNWPERAARFIYLNRFCFNGLYRTNRDGKFNVPFAGVDNMRTDGWGYLRDAASRLDQNTTILRKPFEKTLELVKKGDFVYLDPPYSIRSRRVFNEYSNASFGEKQLLALRAHLIRMNKIGIPFLVSYGQSKEAHFLAQGFRKYSTLVRRHIAGFGSNRRKAREIIITNF